MIAWNILILKESIHWLCEIKIQMELCLLTMVSPAMTTSGVIAVLGMHASKHVESCSTENLGKVCELNYGVLYSTEMQELFVLIFFK